MIERAECHLHRGGHMWTYVRGQAHRRTKHAHDKNRSNKQEEETQQNVSDQK